MKDNVLITGGAGFIGSHLADELIEHGYRVRVLDNLSEQVHGPGKKCPAYLNKDVELFIGDVRDPDAVRPALKGIDVVYHFAAAVGVGQSMYRIRDYVETNNTGTAVLLEELIAQPVKKLIVASSMSIYGEGLYQDKTGRFHEVQERFQEQLKAGDWELYDKNGEPLSPVPTPETKSANLSSVYALSKYDQEKLCLMIGQAYNIPTVALRFFNVYGTRQALSNPYTGVLAIFASRLLNNNPPMIFEDGMQKRDFVHVKDVSHACRLAMETSGIKNQVFNIGSGRSYTVAKVAELLSVSLGKKDIQPEITEKYRVGDIRHCTGDISKAAKMLGYEPQITLQEGLLELVDWLKDQTPEDKVPQAKTELISRGLAV